MVVPSIEKIINKVDKIRMINNKMNKLLSISRIIE